MKESHICCFLHNPFAEHRFPSEGMAIADVTLRWQRLAWVFAWCGRNCVTFIDAMIVKQGDASNNSDSIPKIDSQWCSENPPFSHHPSKGTLNPHSALGDGFVANHFGGLDKGLGVVDRDAAFFGS